MRRAVTNPDVPLVTKTAQQLDSLKHKPFQEFSIRTLDDLVKELDAPGQRVEVLTIEGVPHLICGKPFANLLVQSNSIGQVPGDLLAIFQYCEGCKVAVRVL